MDLEDKKKKADYMRGWRSRNPGKSALVQRNIRRRLKQEIIDAYGGHCVCCGETAFEFLTIDHIFGGGGHHHKKAKTTYQIYLDIRNAGYLKDIYRLLCMNCNFSYGKYGHCPHQVNLSNLINNESALEVATVVV